MVKKPWRKILARNQRLANRFAPLKRSLLRVLESAKVGYDIRAYLKKKQKTKSLARRRSAWRRRL